MLEATLIMIIGLVLFFIVFFKAIQFECGIYPCQQTKKTPTYTVITVKNNEDCIEGIIHTLIKELQLKNTNFSSSNILVIDLGSCDDTLKILKKISNKYEFIHILNCNSYIDMVNQ